MRLLPTTLSWMLAFLLAASGWAQSGDGTLTVPTTVPRGATPTGALAAENTIPMTIPGSGRSDRPEYQTYIDPGCYAMYSQSQFQVAVEALLLKLDRPAQQDLVLNSLTNSVLLRTGDLDFGVNVGPRITVGYTGTPEEGTSFEASYFGIYDWNADRTVLGLNNLRLPGNVGNLYNDFATADGMQVYYESRINNVEANVLYREQGWNISFLGGVRFIRLDEFIGITSIENNFGAPSVYNVDARNDMFGGQIGARYRTQYNCWELDAWTKFGIFGNTAVQHNFLTDIANIYVLRDTGLGRTHTAFVADMNISLGYHIRQNLILRAGYNVMWLEGVARAPDQLDFTVNAASGGGLRYRSAFLHGANFGLEARW